ncbi:MAG: NAD(P)/FAD-dependent oxidoreductase, partial [Candidatus Aenigmatarchaeota archaeon]
SGLTVAVYDRREELGVPVRCGEGVEKKIEDFTGPIPSRAICQRVKGARIYAPNGRFLEAPGLGYVLDRKVFDKWLAEEAVKAGARIQVNTLITDLVIEGGKVCGVRGISMGQHFESRAKVVIAATGAESPLAMQAGIRTNCPMQLVDTCLEYEMSGIKFRRPDDEEYIHIYLNNDIAPRGYAWVFPKGSGSANVGLGVAPSVDIAKSARAYQDKFVSDNPDMFLGASILEVKAGVVPVGGLIRNMVADGFLVCGEAAHHVNPIHGGGIKEAVVSGQIAADVVARAIKSGDVSKSALAEFNTQWWNTRGEHLSKVEKLREVVEKLTNNDLNSLVDALKPEDIIEFSRGERLSVLAKALMRKPSLIALARHLI